MFKFIKDLYNYEERKIDKTNVDGITVSTCYTSDEGYETALIDEIGVHPVERYKSKKDAIQGHEKWCKEAKTVETVVKLGLFDGFVPDEVITIVRKRGVKK